MNRRMFVTLVGLILVLQVTMLVGLPTAQAQGGPTPFRIEFLTGSDGTDNTLVVELFGPGADEPFWWVSVAEGTGDLQPGQLNSYSFPIPAGFCDVVQVHVRKPANIVSGDDAWDIREFYVYVDNTEVAFDRVAYEVFSPFTTTHWPINLNWQGTQAYQSRCGTVSLPSIVGDLVPVGDGIFSVLNTPAFVPVSPNLSAMSNVGATPGPTLAVTLAFVPAQPNLSILPTPTVAMGLVPTGPINCPGFLPSRLQVNGRGRVLPGAANNLRSNSSPDSTLIGQIPGGGEFSVLEGPVCDQLGIAWWRVVYQNLTGWTGEGQGNTYWVEPVP